MSLIKVDLGKSFNGQELEKILLDAAKEIGINAKSSDKYNEIVRLNPVRKEETDYDHTNIRLQGVGYADINIDKHSTLKSSKILLDQHCLDEEMYRYLGAVYKRISKTK